MLQHCNKTREDGAIFMTTILGNRHEIEKFVRQAEDGFQWKHYFQFLGVLELDMNVEAIATRTRNAIKVRTYNSAT